jgi:glycosyltransferase involved in cell wall biosynthesis
MKVIISTGQGRLHLIESARSLIKSGIDVQLVTGWVPYCPDWVINFLGRLVGRTNLAYGFTRRRELGKERTLTCGLSEFYMQFLFILSRFGWIKREDAAVLGWKRFGKQSRRYLKDAQIFHVRSGAGQGGAIEYARKKGMKIIVDHSAAHPQSTYEQLKKAGITDEDISIKPSSVFWQLVLKDCGQADILLVNSDYVKETFVKNGYEAEKICIAYLGIRKDFFDLKTNWDLSDTVVRLLFTGNFGFLKGGQLILECMQQLRETGLRFYLDIVGSVSMPIPDWVKESNSVIFHGHLSQDRLKSFMETSDIYIFPSYSEGSAQSLKEAMAAGMPVIATRQSGTPIIHGENGYIIQDNSSEALINAIIELTQNDALRGKIGKNAAETIKLGHTWDNYASNVIRIYQRLLLD